MNKGVCKWGYVVPVVFALFFASALAINTQAQPPEPPGALGPTLELHAGWNMISSPVRSVPIEAIQGDCLISNGPWWWTGTRYELSSTIEPAKGYWVKVGNPCTMEAISLARHFVQTLALVHGWNMISSSSSWNDTNTGGCKLLSGPWWWDGQKYQQIAPDQPLEGFKGYWVKIDDSCIVDSVKSQALHSGWDGSLLPPGPPAEAQGLLSGLLKWLGIPQKTAAPQASVSPLTLQEVRLTALRSGQVELQLKGTGITQSELRFFNLAGELVADKHGTGNTLRFSLLATDGRPLANGVYLYLIVVQGVNGQTTSSEVRKVLIVR